MLLSGCITSSRGVGPRTEVDQLGDALEKLHQGVCPTEAQAIARGAFQHAGQLADRYRAVRPAWLHNVFVNAGVRDRGLCYHWANDLDTHLTSLGADTLEIYLCAARVGTFREHNALVVTACDQPFETGIVLDAWRRSGRLYWGRVCEDKFPWLPLENERTRVEGDFCHLTAAALTAEH